MPDVDAKDGEDIDGFKRSGTDSHVYTKFILTPYIGVGMNMELKNVFTANTYSPVGTVGGGHNIYTRYKELFGGWAESRGQDRTVSYRVKNTKLSEDPKRFAPGGDADNGQYVSIEDYLIWVMNQQDDKYSEFLNTVTTTDFQDRAHPMHEARTPALTRAVELKSNDFTDFQWLLLSDDDKKALFNPSAIETANGQKVSLAGEKIINAMAKSFGQLQQIADHIEEDYKVDSAGRRTGAILGAVPHRGDLRGNFIQWKLHDGVLNRKFSLSEDVTDMKDGLYNEKDLDFAYIGLSGVAFLYEHFKKLMFVWASSIAYIPVALRRYTIHDDLLFDWADESETYVIKPLPFTHTRDDIQSIPEEDNYVHDFYNYSFADNLVMDSETRQTDDGLHRAGRAQMFLNHMNEEGHDTGPGVYHFAAAFKTISTTLAKMKESNHVKNNYKELLKLLRNLRIPVAYLCHYSQAKERLHIFSDNNGAASANLGDMADTEQRQPGVLQMESDDLNNVYNLLGSTVFDLQSRYIDMPGKSFYTPPSITIDIHVGKNSSSVRMMLPRDETVAGDVRAMLIESIFARRATDDPSPYNGIDVIEPITAWDLTNIPTEAKVYRLMRTGFGIYSNESLIKLRTVLHRTWPFVSYHHPEYFPAASTSVLRNASDAMIPLDETRFGTLCDKWIETVKDANHRSPNRYTSSILGQSVKDGKSPDLFIDGYSYFSYMMKSYTRLYESATKPNSASLAKQWHAVLEILHQNAQMDRFIMDNRDTLRTMVVDVEDTTAPAP